MLRTQPQRYSSSELLILGETTFRNHHRRFGILSADRLRHLWLMGKTGSGKSTLLASLIIQDLRAGRGIAVLDPHGDLIEQVLPYVPKHRTGDVVLFDPQDRDHPVAFNPFRQKHQPDDHNALLASQLVATFKKQFGDSWGYRLEHILRNAILAIAPHPKATLLYLYRFLTDEGLRHRMAPGIKDPVVKAYWLKEFPGYGKNLQGEALAAVQNKFSGFVSHPTVRNILSQERSRIDLGEVLAGRGVLLASLATGKIGEDAGHLLGGLLLSSIQMAAMSRDRGGPPFYVYVDEFQAFVTDSVATVLSEARKFGLGLTLSHQFLSQLPEAVRDAVIGNVGTSIMFRLGSDDSYRLEREFAPFTDPDLQALDRYHVAVKLMHQGQTLPPFSARTLAVPPVPGDGDLRTQVIREQSRARYAVDRLELERAIERSLRH